MGIAGAIEQWGQFAKDGDVDLGAQSRFHFGHGHIGGEDALVVLGEDAVVEAALAELTIQEPEPEQIVAELFAEELLAAHGVERGQHAGLGPKFCCARRSRNARSLRSKKVWQSVLMTRCCSISPPGPAPNQA